MWKRISRWRQTRQYQRRKSKVHRCSLYVVGDFGIALPALGISVTFPDAPVLKHLSAQMHDAQTIGDSIVAALDYAATAKRQAAPKDHRISQAEFLDGMERYRQSIGVGKRRFESDMQLVYIQRTEAEIRLNKTNRAHGRFAFEGTASEPGKFSLSSPASPAEIGAAVLSLLR